MRTTLAAITLMLVMCIGATIGMAQAVTEKSSGKAQERLQDARAKVLVVSIQDLDLSGEQEAQIAAIRKEYKSKIEEGSKELKTLVKEESDQIRNVLSPEQLPKIKAILEERKEAKEESLAQSIASLKDLDLTEAEVAKIGEIRNEYRAKIEGAVKQLGSLLSDTQKAAREEAIEADKSRRETLQALNLTGAQRAELGNIAKEFKDLVGNEAAKIKGVLTTGQKETLQDLRAERKELVRDRLAHQIANLRDLNLTEQQKESLMNIRQEFRPKIQEAGNGLRSVIREELGKIVDVVKPAGVVAERPENVR
jgi:Spy/CpxP family protein refolding chaperone